MYPLASGGPPSNRATPTGARRAQGLQGCRRCIRPTCTGSWIHLHKRKRTTRRHMPPARSTAARRAGAQRSATTTFEFNRCLDKSNFRATPAFSSYRVQMAWWMATRRFRLCGCLHPETSTPAPYCCITGKLLCERRLTDCDNDFHERAHHRKQRFQETATLHGAQSQHCTR